MFIQATGPTKIVLDWSPVPLAFQNGIVRGYKVIYKKTGEISEQILRLTPATVVSTTIGHLGKFTMYSFRLLAFTIKGDGPSLDMVQMTHQDSKSN